MRSANHNIATFCRFLTQSETFFITKFILAATSLLMPISPNMIFPANRIYPVVCHNLDSCSTFSLAIFNHSNRKICCRQATMGIECGFRDWPHHSILKTRSYDKFPNKTNGFRVYTYFWRRRQILLPSNYVDHFPKSFNFSTNNISRRQFLLQTLNYCLCRLMEQLNWLRKLQFCLRSNYDHYNEL